MNIQSPKSIADIEEYIRVHETKLGFRPNAIGVTLEGLEAISAECKKFIMYREAVWSSDGPIIRDLHVYEIPIIYSKKAK